MTGQALWSLFRRRRGASARGRAAAGNRPPFYLSAVAILAALPIPAAAQVLFETSDQNPFIQIHTLPSPSESPLVAAGETSLDWRFDLANNSISEAHADGEQAILDGETWRLTLHAEHAVGEHFSVGLSVPLLKHRGGLLDSPIRRWHELWGLSNTRREDFEDDRLRYTYARGGLTEGVEGTTAGLGDIRLGADWRLRPAVSGRRSLSARAGLKLPTGSSGALRGSGGTDLSLQLLATDPQTLARWHTTIAWSFGALWLGDGKLLDELRREFVPIASLGASRPVLGRLDLVLQIDAHGRFYDSGLDILGEPAVQLVTGGRYNFGGGGWLELGFTENLSTDPTPDFGLNLRWHQPLRRAPPPAASR
jgi:hypothetical protein